MAASKPDPTAESALKHLPYMVSTSNEDVSLVDRPPRIQSAALVPNSMATVIKAVAEASEDVRKVKHFRSVFDRLSSGENPAESQLVEHREALIEDEEYGGIDQFPSETQSTYFDSHGQFDGDMTMTENDSVLATDYVSDFDLYEETDIRARNNVSHSDAFGEDDEGLIMVHHNIANDGDDGMGIKWNKKQDEPPVTRITSHKMVSLPDSISTRRLRPRYQAVKDVPASQCLKHLQKNVAAFSTFDVQAMQEKVVSHHVSHGNVRFLRGSHLTCLQHVLILFFFYTDQIIDLYFFGN